jgi:2-hydroxycyclohexanecarboxyl-CoA dehydrogenase
LAVTSNDACSAGAVLFLASDDAEFITSQTISVSGGLTIHG